MIVIVVLLRCLKDDVLVYYAVSFIEAGELLAFYISPLIKRLTLFLEWSQNCVQWPLAQTDWDYALFTECRFGEGKIANSARKRLLTKHAGKRKVFHTWSSHSEW